MMQKLKDYIAEFDEEIMINKKLLFFEMLAALLGGIVIGMLMSPFKSVAICSNNENIGNTDECCKDE